MSHVLPTLDSSWIKSEIPIPGLVNVQKHSLSDILTQWSVTGINYRREGWKIRRRDCGVQDVMTYSQMPNKRGGISENSNKRVGWEFSEKFNKQSRDYTIRQDARVVEYDFWREISRQKCTRASVKCSSNICFCRLACDSLSDLKN